MVIRVAVSLVNALLLLSTVLMLHLHVNCIFWSANGILGCRLDSLAVCMHCVRLMKLLGLQVCSSSEQQCDKQAWSKAVHHSGCESVADQRVHRDDGCGRVSQMATAAGSLGSRLDTGNQSVHVSQRCNSVNDQEEGSSDEENSRSHHGQVLQHIRSSRLWRGCST